MSETIRLRWLYFISGIFLTVSAVSIAHGYFWYLFIPLAFLVLYLAIFSIDALILLAVFATPLAVNIRNQDFNIGVSIPSEPLMFGIMLLFLFKLFHEGNYERRILAHPVTIAIIFNLVWIGITTLTSSIPLVSLKFLTARLWFVTVFYFFSVQLFQRIGNMKKFVWLYCIPFLGVIVYTVVRHAQNGFTQKTEIGRAHV